MRPLSISKTGDILSSLTEKQATVLSYIYMYNDHEVGVEPFEFPSAVVAALRRKKLIKGKSVLTLSKLGEQFYSSLLHWDKKKNTRGMLVSKDKKHRESIADRLVYADKKREM